MMRSATNGCSKIGGGERNMAFFNIDLACFNIDLYLKMSSPPCQLLSLINQKLEIKIVTRILTKYIYLSIFHFNQLSII